MMLLVFFCMGDSRTGAKEMRLGEFAQKCKEATCYLQSTKPYSPWSNSTKREIRELKKGATRKLTQSGAPQVDGVLLAGVITLYSLAHCT